MKKFFKKLAAAGGELLMLPLAASRNAFLERGNLTLVRPWNRKADEAIQAEVVRRERFETQLRELDINQQFRIKQGLQIIYFLYDFFFA